MISDILTSSATHSIKMAFQKKKERNIIIDPFSCLVKLSLIRFLDEGTKVSINQNRLNFNSPGYIQGFIRFMYGDNREDLHNILLPLQKCVEWFYSENNPDMLYMFNNAVLGLKFLKKSYSTYATIQHTIDYYIIILMQKNNKLMSLMGIDSIDIDKLTNNSSINNIQQSSKQQSSKQQSSNKGKLDDTNNEETNSIKILDKHFRDIHKFLFELWNLREINIVINLYKEFEEKAKNPESEYIYSNIMQYCEMKESKLYKYIEENSSIL